MDPELTSAVEKAKASLSSQDKLERQLDQADQSEQARTNAAYERVHTAAQQALSFLQSRGVPTTPIIFERMKSDFISIYLYKGPQLETIVLDHGWHIGRSLEHGRNGEGRAYKHQVYLSVDGGLKYMVPTIATSLPPDTRAYQELIYSALSFEPNWNTGGKRFSERYNTTKSISKFTSLYTGIAELLARHS